MFVLATNAIWASICSDQYESCGCPGSLALMLSIHGTNGRKVCRPSNASPFWLCAVPFIYAALMRQISVHADVVFPMPVKSCTVELISFGSVDTVRLGSESTQCIHPKHVCA